MDEETGEPEKAGRRECKSCNCPDCVNKLKQEFLSEQIPEIVQRYDELVQEIKMLNSMIEPIKKQLEDLEAKKSKLIKQYREIIQNQTFGRIC